MFAREEPSLIEQQQEEMGRIKPNKEKQKKQDEKKYKKKHDLATPKPLEPRQKCGQNLNASNRRDTGSKAKGISINDPPPQLEQPTHEEFDSDTPTEQSDEEVNEEKSGGKEIDEEEIGGEDESEKQVDEEIREVQEQVQGGDVQEQGKKKDVPKKKKGDHMPDPEKMFLRGPKDPVYGSPGDGGQMLWGYNDSWAVVDHKDVVRLMKPETSVSMMRQWLLEGIESTVGEVPEVVDLFNSMGLIPAIENLDLGYDRPLCSAFAERYYGETDTLHLPFGELTITPHYAKFITGLSIEGKAVKSKWYAQELEWDNIYALTKYVFQWDEERTKSEMLVGNLKQRIFHLSKLRDNFMGTKKLRAEGKEVAQERIISTANAYVLYVLGAVIFPEVSGARMSANFIQMLQPFNKIHEYSWGTSILAHSLNELRKASRAKRNQM
ncbi:uncharacterized protein LOC113351575 [Papaver somniferum]|uniref:uncharacterized protein LOC113351575 n=1 Tax=Papaver somniferum TaxID=3469 RepID=UPI000E6FC770|nr:uncharacterized protein LOC113351575 [Papaver somniferum]